MNKNNDTPNGCDSQAAESQEEQFTPIFDSLVSEYNTMTALVFGVIWRHCQRKRKVCDASIETMADLIGVGRRTVERCIKVLVADKLIVDKTPGLKHRTHTYTLSSQAKERFPKNKNSASQRRTEKSEKQASASESRTQCVRESHCSTSESRIRIHHEDTKEDTSSCDLDSEKPETANAKQTNDDDAIFSDIHSGLVVLGLEDKASRDSLIAKCKIKDSGKLKKLVGYWLEWEAGGGEKPGNWRGSLQSYAYTKIVNGEEPPQVKKKYVADYSWGNVHAREDDIPDLESGPEFIRDGEIEYVEVQPEPESNGQMAVDPEWFDKAMTAAKAKLAQPEVPACYDPETNSYNL